jgi:hypothetical protein
MANGKSVEVQNRKSISNGKWQTANFKWAEVLLRKKPLG